MIKLLHFSVNNCVWLLWVPGHSNIGGSKTPDELAKQAASLEFVGPEPVLGLSVISAKCLFEKCSVHEQKNDGITFKVVIRQSN